MAPSLRSAAEGHAEGRDQLVRAKRAVGNPVRGRLRSFGYRLPAAVGDQEVRRGGASEKDETRARLSP